MTLEHKNKTKEENKAELVSISKSELVGMVQKLIKEEHKRHESVNKADHAAQIRSSAMANERDLAALDILAILLEVAGAKVPMTSYIYRSDVLIRISAKSDLEVTYLESAPSSRDQLRASIRLLMSLQLNNLEFSHIMWPETAMRMEKLREKAKTILAEACDQINVELCKHD
jgi:hypothetical protein